MNIMSYGQYLYFSVPLSVITLQIEFVMLVQDISSTTFFNISSILINKEYQSIKVIMNHFLSIISDQIQLSVIKFIMLY